MEGTKCSSVPQTPHPLEVCVVFVALVLECGDEALVVVSVLIFMLEWRCLVVAVVYPLVLWGCLPLCMIIVVSSLKKCKVEMVVAEW